MAEREPRRTRRARREGGLSGMVRTFFNHGAHGDHGEERHGIRETLKGGSPDAAAAAEGPRGDCEERVSSNFSAPARVATTARYLWVASISRGARGRSVAALSGCPSFSPYPLPRHDPGTHFSVISVRSVVKKPVHPPRASPASKVTCIPVASVASAAVHLCLSLPDLLSAVPKERLGGVNLQSECAPEIESALCKKLFSYWLPRSEAA
jgi:hypothetical protein